MGFNGIELELTWDDLDDLERAIRHGQLPNTEGFFFGKPADNHYYEQDLEFVNILENRSTREFVSYSPETCILLMSNTLSLLSPSFRIITSVENKRCNLLNKPVSAMICF